MFGINLFGDALLGDSAGEVSVPRSWVNQCPGDSGFVNQAAAATSWSDQSVAAENWNEIDGDTLPVKRCT